MSVRSDSDTPVSVPCARFGSSLGATERGRFRLVGRRFGVNVGVARADHRLRTAWPAPEMPKGEGWRVTPMFYSGRHHEGGAAFCASDSRWAGSDGYIAGLVPMHLCGRLWFARL